MDEELRKSTSIEYRRARRNGDQVILAIEFNFGKRGDPQGAQPPPPGTLELSYKDNSYNPDLDNEYNYEIVDNFLT